MKLKNKVYKPYDKLYTSEKGKIVCMSGRTSGKTYATADYLISRVSSEKNCDAVIARAASDSLRTSVYSVIQRRIRDLGLSEYFDVSLRPMVIKNKLTGNVIHFIGIDSADINRTKGFEPSNAVGIV
jgi:phage terminase large subunit